MLGFEHDEVWPNGQPPEWAAGLVLAGVSIACLIYLNQRTRGVEIVRVSTLPPPAPIASNSPVLLFEQVSKWYGPVIGINQVSLELRPGITGLVGHNGSGKSTLLRLAAGHNRPDLGRVLVAGHDAFGAAAKRHLGYCPELDRFYEEMTGRDFIQTMAQLSGFGRSDARQQATAEVLEIVGMSDRADRVLAGYSKGMRRRIKLAQALVHDPALLLFWMNP